MPNFAAYVTAGGLLVMTIDFIAPAARTGLPVAARPTIDRKIAQVITQYVDRTHKGDRLTLPATVADKRHTPVRHSSKALIGCDPVFSPFSPAARLNFPRRCVVEVASAWTRLV